MSLDPRQLDEWLSAHLDGQLSEPERVRLLDELEQNQDARRRLDALRSTQLELKGFFSDRPKAMLGPEFTSRVLSSVEPNRLDSVTHRGESTPTRWSQVAAALALAGAILIAVSLPTWLTDGSANSTNSNSLSSDALASNAAANKDVQATRPDLLDGTNDNAIAGTGLPVTGPESVDPSTSQSPQDGSSKANAVDSVQYVGDLQFPALQYVLIVDVTLTQQAMDNGTLQKVFAKAGIPTARPIIATQRLEKLVSEARMTVGIDEEEATDADADADESESWLFYVRAPMADLGRALDEIYKDERHFPEVTLDLGYQTARSELLRTIAKSTTNRFLINESFAASVVATNELDSSVAESSMTEGLTSSTSNPFRQASQFTTPLPKRFVSKSARQAGFETSPSSTDDKLENLILYVRVIAN